MTVVYVWPKIFSDVPFGYIQVRTSGRQKSSFVTQASLHLNVIRNC